jgi:hypothetical protein
VHRVRENEVGGINHFPSSLVRETQTTSVSTFLKRTECVFRSARHHTPSDDEKRGRVRTSDERHEGKRIASRCMSMTGMAVEVVSIHTDE